MVNGEFNFYFQHSAFIIQHSEGYNLVDAVANLRRVLIIDSQVMASSTPLQGTELVDCARANAITDQEMILQIGSGEVVAPDTASEL